MGNVLSGGRSRPVTTDDLQLAEQMREDLSRLPVPTLQHRGNPHEYLYFAFFDGTGQDRNNPDLGPPTNVGVLHDQAAKLAHDPDNRMGAYYSKGIGSQSNAVSRAVDGALALTWEDGIKKAYEDLAKQARTWTRADPEAQISIAGMGYSRGAVQEMGFHRLVDQYGILPPEDLRFGYDHHGNLTVESPYPPLVPPGQTMQVAVLLDPVATGFPKNYDARLPPSVISSVSIMAANEQRELFPHQTINAPGMTPDGRAINVKAPGGHSNIGGGNREPGLEIMVGNAVTDYLNLLRDEPMFDTRPIPTDPSKVTVYQARGATAAWGLKLDHDGQRNLREELANCIIVDPCKDPEPMNPASAARQPEYRHIQPNPQEQAQQRILFERVEQAPGKSLGATEAEPAPLRPAQADVLTDRYLRALAAGDDEGARAASLAFGESEYGQRLVHDTLQRIAEEQQWLPGRDNPLFAQAVQHLEQLGPDVANYTDRADMERIAGAIAHEAKRHHLPAIDRIVPTRDGELMATWTSPRNDAVRYSATVDPIAASAQPLESSFQQLEAETQRQAQEELQREQRRQMEHGMSR